MGEGGRSGVGSTGRWGQNGTGNFPGACSLLCTFLRGTHGPASPDRPSPPFPSPLEWSTSATADAVAAATAPTLSAEALGAACRARAQRPPPSPGAGTPRCTAFAPLAKPGPCWPPPAPPSRATGLCWCTRGPWGSNSQGPTSRASRPRPALRRAQGGRPRGQQVRKSRGQQFQQVKELTVEGLLLQYFPLTASSSLLPPQAPSQMVSQDPSPLPSAPSCWPSFTFWVCPWPCLPPPPTPPPSYPPPPLLCFFPFASLVFPMQREQPSSERSSFVTLDSDSMASVIFMSPNATVLQLRTPLPLSQHSSTPLPTGTPQLGPVPDPAPSLAHQGPLPAWMKGLASWQRSLRRPASSGATSHSANTVRPRKPRHPPAHPGIPRHTRGRPRHGF